MNDSHEKIVRFDIWCKKCKYGDQDEELDPCFECLGRLTNFESTKPIKFVEKSDEK